MHFVLLLTSLLASLISASPVILDHFPLRIPNQSAPNTTTSNSRLSSYPSSPTGPDDFKVVVSHPALPLQQKALLVSALHIIGALSVDDWTSPLADARTLFRDPEYPTLKIAVASMGSQRIQRRYVLWGIASALHDMYLEGRFIGCVLHLSWQGREVGRIHIVDTAGLSHQTFGNYTTVTLTQPVTNQANDTTTAVGADQLSWDYEFKAPILPSADIFMGTIASLIQLAEQTIPNFDHFVGSWPHTNINLYQIWQSVTTPSTMSKSILAMSMVAAVNHAVASSNYHALTIKVRNRGQIIAEGAYIGFNRQLPAAVQT